MRRELRAVAVVSILVLAWPTARAAEAADGDFAAQLAEIDAILRTNPEHLPQEVLISCEARRRTALRLYRSGHDVRALRSLRFCRQVLHVPDHPKQAVETAQRGPTPEELQARAAAEIESALHLTPNLANGLRLYRECAACHSPEGWGLSNGSVPQIAGQHRRVLIKQLADIRSGNRDNVLMLPYATAEVIGGPQAVADVTGYVDTLEISTANGKGEGNDLDLGAKLYRDNCARCHGESGEGDDAEFVPRIQAQHYDYLVRQFEWIRSGKRRNANDEMVEQIQGFGDRETHAVLDYVSRLEPPLELQAPEGWKNPDF